jgi:hypothetical protein
MKTFLVIAAILFVLLFGAIAMFLWVGTSATPPASTAISQPAASAPAESARSNDETLARLDALSREITDLREEVAVLKAGAQRESVTAAAVDAKPESVETSAAVSPVQRDAILKVIADDRAEQKRKQDEEQAQRDLQNALARADKAALKYGLTVDQKKGLVDVLVVDAQKSNDLRTQMMNQGFNGDREAMRKAFTDLDTWRMDELTKRMGPDLAQQVHDGEFNGFFGGGGPQGQRRGGNRGGGGGPGGG